MKAVILTGGKGARLKPYSKILFRPLDTASPLKLITDLEKNFLVMNGGILANMNFLT